MRKAWAGWEKMSLAGHFWIALWNHKASKLPQHGLTVNKWIIDSELDSGITGDYVKSYYDA